MRTLIAVFLLAMIAGVMCNERASLIVSKLIVTKSPIANNDAIVSIRIFNVGDGYVCCVTI